MTNCQPRPWFSNHRYCRAESIPRSEGSVCAAAIDRWVNEGGALVAGTVGEHHEPRESSPNLRAHVELFIQSLKFEVPDRFVIVAERHLNHVCRAWQQHYNAEWPYDARGHLPPGCEKPPFSDLPSAALPTCGRCDLTKTTYRVNSAFPRPFLPTLRGTLPRPAPSAPDQGEG